MSRYSILHAIEHLDPEKDHQRIVFLSTCYDLPFDTTRELEFALFRTFVSRAYRFPFQIGFASFEPRPEALR
jgi:hypothetical protein